MVYWNIYKGVQWCAYFLYGLLLVWLGYQKADYRQLWELASLWSLNTYIIWTYSTGQCQLFDVQHYELWVYAIEWQGVICMLLQKAVIWRLRWLASMAKYTYPIAPTTTQTKWTWCPNTYVKRLFWANLIQIITLPTLDKCARVAGFDWQAGPV